jgi:transcriptional regulator with XRE-family HTH domain
MTTKKPKKVRRSEATAFLEKLGGGPLTFGRLLYSIRMGDEISQVEFAKKLGISKAHLCDIEKDRRVVSPSRAWAWGKKLGYSPEQFIELALQSALEREGLHFQVKLVSAA